MKVAFGVKAHSGWAAFVVVGATADGIVIVDRRRLELVQEAWEKQPYHAAEKLPSRAACELVERGVAAARRIATQEMRDAVGRERARGNDVTACAVLSGAAMPDWSTEDILAVHVRMHKAEGALFRDALLRAGNACNLRAMAVPEKTLTVDAERMLGTSAATLTKTMAALGKTVGAPWGKDQKDAVLAAMMALRSR